MKKAMPVRIPRVEELARELTQELEQAAKPNDAACDGDRNERSRPSRPDSFRASGSKHAIM